ncbi:MAG TPA: cobalt transporter CbiM [Spirochaetota bacterium]|nr:cobalt transporter CbiM [Spirochaetota bacterium]HPC42540.1 cobalt transporter CbiM [Spirochaetota bacterium]HPL15494.1 cobalt transporter CbiM [Spirochaetota bacterium]HQF10172.1 cobalt transporter CbiM [Spirochaetota bacterium]HQH98956.1 cobalt transporter CbiM [Spirochaetota bacterium]
MHIPDGYLSPQTYVPLYVAFGGFIAAALRKVRQTVSTKNIPYLGMAAAFSFLIMMFNVPIPGGTTGHAVGASIVAIVLGPWVAMVAISVALIIQAFLFGDGGITAIGANCFNMAVVMPFVSIIVFKLVRGKASGGWRVYLAAFLSGYIGLAIAALVTAVEFGIQPLIASADGKPLYAPYGLEVAVPAMAIEHLILFSIVEGLITMLVLAFFLKGDPDNIYAMKEVGK